MYNYGTKEWFEEMFSTAQEGIDCWGHQWRASQQYRYQLSLDIIKPLLTEKGAQSIIDIGCGLGDFTHLMYQVNKRNKFYGMDISKNAIDGAAKKYPKFHFQCAALPEFAFQEKFDGIVSLDCVCYLNGQNRINAVNNISNHLNSKGWYLFSSPLDDGARYFSQKLAIDILEMAGFKIEHLRYNNARLYNLFEIPFLKLINLHRIILELDRGETLVPSKRKENIQRLMRIPLLGNFIKQLSTFLNSLSFRILGSMLIVKFFQWISRTFFKESSKSHLLILAFKNQ